MRIAILDWLNQDIGLNILFPNADYYIKEIEYPEYKNDSMKRYNINPIYDWSTINDSNYDCLFIISSLFDHYPIFDDSFKQISLDLFGSGNFYNKIINIMKIGFIRE